MHLFTVMFIFLLLFSLFRVIKTTDVYSYKSSTFVSTRIAIMITVVIYGGWWVTELFKLLFAWML